MKKIGWILFCLSIFSEAFGVSLSEAADGLYKPVYFITLLVPYFCYVIGFALIIGSAAQYQLHRQNPKLTPLMTPIFVLFLGIVTAGLPYLSNVFGNSWSASAQEERGSVGGSLEAPQSYTSSQSQKQQEGGFWGEDY